MTRPAAYLKQLVALLTLVFLGLPHLWAAPPAAGMATPSTDVAAKLYPLLLELNPNWTNRQPDFRAVASSCFGEEVTLIQTHLRLVIEQLEAADVAHLEAAQLRQRRVHIRTLRSYMSAARFPMNVFRPGLCPVFIDPWGTHCAVGHLIATSGHQELATRINNEHQLDFLRDIKTEGLSEWQLSSGLTFDELALIQPQYAWRLRSMRLSYPKEIEQLMLGHSQDVVNALQCGDLDVEARCGGKTLIHFAAAAGDLDLVKMLVQRGADLHTVSQAGCSPTDIGSLNRHLSFVLNWGQPTQVTEVKPKGYGGFRVAGAAYSTARSSYIADVLRDLAGGDAEKNALYYATADPRPTGNAIPTYRSIRHAGIRLKGMNKPPSDPKMEQLKEGRAAVAAWLREQGLK